jgi:hypothetical protein
MKIVAASTIGFDGKNWGPKDFETEHAMIQGRKVSAWEYHYIACPKRLPRKLKKQQKKLKMKRIYPESPEACFVNKQGAN